MKLRVLFLKKKYIYYFFAFSIVCVLSLIFINFNPSNSVFNIIDINKSLKADFTGDGEEDILYIKTEKDKYYLQVYSNNQSYYLEPDKKINNVGNYYLYWPMKISILDLNRDKIPEIFIQASSKGIPIQHIFSWNGKEFKDIYCSSNNVMGFIDYRNNKTIKFVSGNLTGAKPSFSYFMYINNNMENFDMSSFSIPGVDEVSSFVKYIQTLPEGESYIPKEIFYPGLGGKDLSLIGKLSGENNTYIFQDASFNDSKWDKEGQISEIKWTLNFKGVSRIDSSQLKNYSIVLKLKPHNECGDTHCYKIFSITSQ